MQLRDCEPDSSSLSGGELIYPESYEPLLRACQQMLTHRQVFAKPLLENHVLEHVGVANTNGELMGHIVADAIMRRLDRRLMDARNIYVEQFDIPQIELFYKLGQAIPHLGLSHRLANHNLVAAMDGLSEITILEIGIGKGVQMRELLREASAAHPSLRSARVIGLDPDPNNLRDAGATIDVARHLCHFAIEYVPILGYVEKLDDAQWAHINELKGRHLVINSAFALHHTGHPLEDDSVRTDLLRRLAGLDPLLLTLVEPNADHDTEDLARRIGQAWTHFGHVFELIDHSNLAAEERFTIKEKFFGREIRDIFGVSDLFRCERHELYEDWLLRLTRAGFEPAPFATFTHDLPAHSALDIADGIARLDFQGLTIISVFAYRPRRRLC